MDRHTVIRLEVYDPSGALRPYYGGPQQVKPGVAAVPVSFRRALNDPPGEWTLRAIDIASGQQVSRTLSAREGQPLPQARCPTDSVLSWRILLALPLRRWMRPHRPPAVTRRSIAVEPRVAQDALDLDQAALAALQQQRRHIGCIRPGTTRFPCAVVNR